MNYIDDLAEDIHEAAHGHPTIDEGDRPLYRMYALLCLSRGTTVANEDVHDAWSCWIVGRPDYDPERPPVRYRELSPEMQRRDTPYRDAIRNVAAQRFAKGEH